jgi:hypothetical protein
MSHHPLCTRLPLLALLTLCGCGATDETAPSAEPTTAVNEPFSTTPGEPNHEQITATALSFLRPEISTSLQVANAATDVEFVLVNANHFDDCNFSGGAQVVSASQAEAVQALNPATVSPDTDVQAVRSFARSLHALQDFYAHTNWVELGGEALVDTSLSSFPTLTPYAAVSTTGFVVVQGPKPRRAAITRDEQAPYPQSAIVSVKLSKVPRAPGLISGTVDYEPGDFCPRSVAMTHEELNKDKSTNLGREQQFEAAKTLAILQTRHEWCRLVALTSAAWGDAGAARLATWVAAGQSQPDCQTE